MARPETPNPSTIPEPAARRENDDQGVDYVESDVGTNGPDAVVPDVTAQESGDPSGEDDSLVADPVEAAQAEVARLHDQLLRTAADFDNFRKRSRRELADAERKAREDLLRDLLPVFDNLERAQAHSDSATDVRSLADGVAMVLRQFYDILGRLGIERISALGKAFDPTFEEAIQQVETAEYEPGTVAAEVQAGYRMGERLIRPAMVVVAKKPSNGG